MNTIDKATVDTWMQALTNGTLDLIAQLQAAPTKNDPSTDTEVVSTEVVSVEPEIGMIGVMTGGVTVAQRLHQSAGIALPLGQLNISFYRDDFSRIGLHPVVGASDIPFTVENRHIILVDDVLHTGRTIRAALNEIFDYGRPASVSLAVLVERRGRELPIQSDISGHRLSLDPDARIKLNTDSMTCDIHEP